MMMMMTLLMMMMMMPKRRQNLIWGKIYLPQEERGEGGSPVCALPNACFAVVIGVIIIVIIFIDTLPLLSPNFWGQHSWANNWGQTLKAIPLPQTFGSLKFFRAVSLNVLFLSQYLSIFFFEQSLRNVGNSPSRRPDV